MHKLIGPAQQLGLAWLPDMISTDVNVHVSTSTLITIYHKKTGKYYPGFVLLFLFQAAKKNLQCIVLSSNAIAQLKNLKTMFSLTQQMR